MDLDFYRSHIRGPVRLGSENVALRSLDVHLHVVGRPKLGDETAHAHAAHSRALLGNARSVLPSRIVLEVHGAIRNPGCRLNQTNPIGPWCNVAGAEGK